MVETKDLVVKGKPSPWKTQSSAVHCIKELSNGNVHLPCIYNKTPKEYERVDFPEPMTTMRPDQQLCLDELMERVDDTKVCNCIFGHLYTGIGKSRIFLWMAIKFNIPILIIVNSDAVRTGWINECEETTGITPHLAGKTLGESPITIASMQICTRHKYGRQQYSYYGVVIVDEADVYCTQKSVNELLDMYPRYLLGCSATVVRQSDGLDKVLDIFWGPRSNWVQRLKEFGETCTMKLVVLHTPYKVEYIYNTQGKMDWGSMIENSTYINDKNVNIRNLCLLHQDKKILILCKTKSHTEVLTEMLREVGEDVSVYYDTLRNYYDAHVLIATVSKAARGYDDKQVSAAFDGRRFNMLIICNTQRDFTQSLGRGLRGDDLLCYVFVDNNPTMKKHASEFVKSLLKRNATVVEEYM